MDTTAVSSLLARLSVLVDELGSREATLRRSIAWVVSRGDRRGPGPVGAHHGAPPQLLRDEGACDQLADFLPELRAILALYEQERTDGEGLSGSATAGVTPEVDDTDPDGHHYPLRLV